MVHSIQENVLALSLNFSNEEMGNVMLHIRAIGETMVQANAQWKEVLEQANSLPLRERVEYIQQLYTVFDGIEDEKPDYLVLQSFKSMPNDARNALVISMKDKDFNASQRLAVIQALGIVLPQKTTTLWDTAKQVGKIFQQTLFWATGLRLLQPDDPFDFTFLQDRLCQHQVINLFQRLKNEQEQQEVLCALYQHPQKDRKDLYRLVSDLIAHYDSGKLAQLGNAMEGIEELEERGWMLSCFSPHLKNISSQEQLEAIVQTLHNTIYLVDSDEWPHILQCLVPCLPRIEKPFHLTECITGLCQICEEARSPVLTALLPHLPDIDGEFQLFELMTALENTEDEMLDPILQHLIPHLPAILKQEDVEPYYISHIIAGLETVPEEKMDFILSQVVPYVKVFEEKPSTITEIIQLWSLILAKLVPYAKVFEEEPSTITEIIQLMGQQSEENIKSCERLFQKQVQEQEEEPKKNVELTEKEKPDVKKDEKHQEEQPQSKTFLGRMLPRYFS